MLEIGQSAPGFSAPDQEENLVSSADFASRWLVLYFYPKDDTPGCTTEAKDFSSYYQQFKDLSGSILGVSPDSTKSHCRFIEKHDLSIQLLSDPDHIIAEAYKVWGLKKFMGKEYMGIIRSTFLIDTGGKIACIWPNVKTKGHAETVLNKLTTLVG
ncbi:MAG: putative peroxiredoxin bcp [Chroococcopsis gigantea SAG 12.99]|jgi:peroxiredoxin Q/BCP|nr:thioredoxin-dependent thiol peroxidase [Chlorogloea purpurea SAG 13.99]MDV3002340.1 putative peroxiredoxin bcp [Chroococcopsis gigantea SAG 12.99]